MTYNPLLMGLDYYFFLIITYLVTKRNDYD